MMKKVIRISLLVISIVTLVLAVYFGLNANKNPDAVGGLHNLEFGLKSLALYGVAAVTLAINLLWSLVNYLKSKKQ